MKSEKAAQSLEFQLKMARPRRAEVKRVPLTPEEKEFLGKIMDKAVAAEKAGKLQEAFDLYTDYKNELLKIKEIKEKEERGKIQWTKEMLVKWAEDIGKDETLVEKIFDLTKLPKLETKTSTNLGFLEIKFSMDECPANMTVNGNLDLTRAEVASWIGSGLIVKGNCDCSKTKIKTLPENIRIEGDLILKDSKIEHLPENIIIMGDLKLSNSNIRNLPDNLIVHGNVYMRMCRADAVLKAQELRKQGKIKGSVYARA